LDASRGSFRHIELGAHSPQNGELFFFAGTDTMAYALAFVLNLEIAREYRDSMN